MKKRICMLLVLALLLSLCACANGDVPSSTTAPQETEPAQLEMLGEYDFYAGFSKVNMTPEEPVPLGGYGAANERISNTVLDELYVEALALTDAEGNTLLFLTWDAVRSYTTTQELARQSIAKVTGVDVSRIFISGSHSHSCPEMHNGLDSAQRYSLYVIEQSTQAAVEAMADRKPATMSVGSIEAEGLSFVRHYTYVDDEGNTQYFGDNFGTWTFNETTAHVGEADPTMYMLYLDRADSDIAMVNWRAHPHLAGSSDRLAISSDWVGPFRDAVYYHTGVNVLYFNGAAGNINEKSRINSENITVDHREYGTLLAQYAQQLMESNLESVQVDSFCTKQTMLDAPVNHEMDHLYYKAKELSAIFSATGNFDTELAMDSGIRSSNQASAIVANYNRGEFLSMELNTVKLADSVVLVTAPNELFDTNSVWLEENSPVEYTLTFCYTNGHYGYVPSAQAWEYTCYETDISYFVPGLAETYQETFLEMIKELDA